MMLRMMRRRSVSLNQLDIQSKMILSACLLNLDETTRRGPGFNSLALFCPCSPNFLEEFFSETPVGSPIPPIPLGPGRSSGRLARLSEVAPRRKEVLIVPKGLSEKAARELADMGYKNVRDYEGAMKDWVDAGLPTEGKH
jgi:hypothetical protein